MKKQTRVLLIIIFIVILSAAAAQYILHNQTNLKLTNLQPRNLSKLEDTVTPSEKVVNTETVSIDFGNGQKMTGQVSTQSAYQALVRVAKDNNLIVNVKQEKYGVMVEKVGKIANSPNAAWIYSINGKPGQIAAGRYTIYPSDKVEWIYKKNSQ